jgi:predicted HicB family RNase H-like nuclease
MAARSPAPSAEATPRVQLLVRIPRELHRGLKHAAVDRNRSLNALVLSALEEWWQAQPDRRRYVK